LFVTFPSVDRSADPASNSPGVGVAGIQLPAPVGTEAVGPDAFSPHAIAAPTIPIANKRARITERSSWF
jgi:hypothetical protein